MQKTWAIFLLFFSLIQATGCSSTPTQQSEVDPAVLYKEAEEDFKHEHYQIAQEKFRVIKNRYPYSKYAVDSALRIGDVLFEQELFSESALAYESFRDLHPKHEKTAYAMYQIGKSYLNDTPSPISRDLTSAQKAIDAYRLLIARFPGTSEAETAKKDLVTARNFLAEKELYIGQFYFRDKAYSAAKVRFEKVTQQFSDTESARVAQSRLDEIKSMEQK